MPKLCAKPASLLQRVCKIPDLDDLLQTPVSWELENTTVAAILETVLAPARLNYQVKPDAIQLHRLGPAAGRAASP